MNATANPPQIPLEEKAYIEFARRKGFSTVTDVDDRPLLRGTKLFQGFQDAFLGNPHRTFDPADRFSTSYQEEYDIGYTGGMYAAFCGESYFKRLTQGEIDKLLRRIGIVQERGIVQEKYFI